MKMEARYYLILAHVAVQVVLILAMGLVYGTSLVFPQGWPEKTWFVLLVSLYAYQFVTTVMGAILTEGWRRDISILFFLMLTVGSLVFVIISILWDIFVWWIYGTILFIGFPLGCLYYSTLEFIHIHNATKGYEVPKGILDADDI